MISNDWMLPREGPYNIYDVETIRGVVLADDYKMGMMKTRGVDIRTAIDVGAHIGTFGGVIRFYWPDALIISVEPNKQNLEHLLFNFNRLSITNFVTYNKAMNYDESKKNFFIHKINPCVSLFLSDQELADKTYKNHILSKCFGDLETSFERQAGDVESITMEQIIEEQGLTSIDVLKFDCEGFEIPILENMTEASRSIVKNVVGEYHKEGGYAAVESFLRSRFPEMEFTSELGIHDFGFFYGVRK
jgi:FkbM family methyltransferase